MSEANYINKEYYLPLLEDFCNTTIPLYNNGDVYNQGPFIPYVMPHYNDAPIKIMYVGRDTFGWKGFNALQSAYKNKRLEDYLNANAECVSVEKMLEWNNNSGSFFNMADKLHLLIRTGEYYPDITAIGEKEIEILGEMGYGNLCSIELPSTVEQRTGCRPITPEYHAIREAAKPFETLKSIIEAYMPDFVFILSWYDKEDVFFDGISDDYIWHKELARQSDEEKEYRAVFSSQKYKTKVVWTLHPNALSFKGFNREDREHLIRFLADTLRLLVSCNI